MPVISSQNFNTTKTAHFIRHSLTLKMNFFERPEGDFQNLKIFLGPSFLIPLDGSSGKK